MNQTDQQSIPTGSASPPVPSAILANSNAVLHVPRLKCSATWRAIPTKNARFSI